ncbi:acyltransferase family protein [Vibrio maritimus]|uniref:acyltransferase family protein n=1 Tax=Vibrio maritimus TaxID=990268 RepID=UPI004067E950
MHFRYDINGLRAIAVVAVVLFHFNPAWIPGGFSGVDVFFVISGFLMTGIIFRGLKNNDFRLLRFLEARANRIIPALAVLCLVLLVFGWFYLIPSDYKTLGEHIASSMAFVSNVVYWKEAGYFDVASNEKWLLHTWSLSTEWQFYILYPIALVLLNKFISIENLKRLILIGTILGLGLSIVATIQSAKSAYYLLPTRAWEMMVGGVSYLYPWKLSKSKTKLIEILGLSLILISYVFVSSDVPWPGYLSLLPVLGTYLVIAANQQSSLITNNKLFQSLGRWSYSIYLWHWPIVVFGYYFDVRGWVFYGLPLSILFGIISFRLVEEVKFKPFSCWFDIFRINPVSMPIIFITVSSFLIITDGFENRMPEQFLALEKDVRSSPYRDKCHIGEYQKPELACEYFQESNVQWATIGDSHTVEIAYALAEKLKKHQQGLKQFSFSNCIPSYLQSDSYSQCARWYNKSVEYIINDQNIKNVVVGHRYSAALYGDHSSIYPEVGTLNEKYLDILYSLDSVIMKLARNKDKVFVYLPVPELKKPIENLLSQSWTNDTGYQNISGASLDFYNKRNELIINHFREQTYPDNVYFLETKEIFCDNNDCFAVRDGKALYFDDDHPSLVGARLLVSLIPLDGR